MTVIAGINNFLFSFLGFKKTKSRQHILLMILIHASGWCLLFFLPVLFYPVRINDDRFIMRELLDKSVLVALFYLNYYWLIPRFFEKRKYSTYIAALFILFTVYLFQHVMIRANYFPRPGGPFQFIQMAPPGVTGKSFDTTAPPFDRKIFAMNGNIMTIDDNADTVNRALPSFPMSVPGLLGVPKGIWAMSLNNVISSFALMMLFGGFIRLAYSFVRNQNEKKALENANLNAEVNFLKSQINPHFLFNTLNGIYSQAHAKSEKTEHSILKLSDLLRYVLYESGEEKVELSKDIQYLNNYIDLQKIRLSSKVKIEYDVEGETKGKRIAPLLLITFVENAFKHGISYSNPSTVKISISIFEQTLTMLVSNPVVETNSFADGGLGLKNVTRRLDILYPSKYLLDIVHNDHLHIVNLKINLNSD
jgi:two-component system LytT family sensor kinase